MGTQGYVGSDLAAFLCHISKSNDSLSFDEKLKQALRLTAPSGFKSGIGTVQLSPLSWNQIGCLKDQRCSDTWSTRLWKNNFSSSNGLYGWSYFFVNISSKHIFSLCWGFRKVPNPSV